MPIRTWTPLLGLAFIAGVLIPSPLLVTFSVSLFIVAAAAEWWRRHSLDAITYRRKFHYRRLFPGEKTSLLIEVENHKLLPVSWLHLDDPWPEAVGPQEYGILAPSHVPGEGYLTHSFGLRWFERVRRDYTLLFRKRGIYNIGPVALESGDLFGTSELRKELPVSEKLTVFPETLPLSDLKLKAEDPFGDRRSHRRLFEDPNQPMGVRDYHPEDDFRRVHWSATARTGQMQVKVYQPVSAQVMVLCLNVSTFPHYWEGVYPELLEQLIKVTATLAYQGTQDGYAVGLISNGCFAHADQPFHLSPGRSPQQLANILQALAGVTPFTTAPFEEFLLKSVPGIPYGATLVIVTALVNQQLAEMLVRLKRYRLHTTLISLAEQPPLVIPGVRCVHLPFSE